jgi:two-component sensor histidine kinase
VSRPAVLAVALPPAAEVRHSVTVDLEPRPRVVGEARAFVEQHAPPLDADTSDALVLLTSELVTNAVIHARTPIELTLVVTRDHVLVLVTDLDLGRREQLSYDRDGGRGLTLVAALAEASALTHHAAGGKTAWFRLRRDRDEDAGRRSGRQS